MNVLEFEVKNQTLTRVDSQDVVNKSKNIYKCRFKFEDESEWIDLNKFAIFTDGWGNSSTQHLGKQGNILSCLVPDKVLQGSYFKISVYAGDLITTNNVSIALIQSGYNHHRKHSCYENSKDIWVTVFDRLDNTIDSIVYDNNTLHLFNRDVILESIYLPFVSEDEVSTLVNALVDNHINDLPVATTDTNGLLSSEDKIKLDSIEEGANKVQVDNSLNSDSENPISNKIVTEALSEKEDKYDVVERIDNLIVSLINNGE